MRQESCTTSENMGSTLQKRKRCFAALLVRDPDTREDYGEKRWIGIGMIRRAAVCLRGIRGTLRTIPFASSRSERQTMKNGKNTKKRSRTDWKRIDAMRDEDIDFSDIPKLGRGLFCERDPLAGAEKTDHFAHRSRRADVFPQAWPGVSEHDQCRSEEIHGSAERIDIRQTADRTGACASTADDWGRVRESEG